jgi:hypothetical protein
MFVDSSNAYLQISALCALRSALCALRSALCALRSALCALRSALMPPPLRIFIIPNAHSWKQVDLVRIRFSAHRGPCPMCCDSAESFRPTSITPRLGERIMCRTLKHVLCAAATLLAFYAGYAWHSKTQAALCGTPGICANTGCVNNQSTNGCLTQRGAAGYVCSAGSSTCWVPDPMNQIMCWGTYSNGNPCQGNLYVCSGPCP